MKKFLQLTLLVLFSFAGFSQSGKYWSASNENPANILKYKAVNRLSFPKEFKLFKLNVGLLSQELFAVVDNAMRHSTTITLPNAIGMLEEFEVFEASNFEAALQAQFPEIRAFSGRGITDKSATLKLSLSPQGVQTMVFRTEKENEFIEAYSQDHTVYAVFNSQRTAGQLPWVCSTQDQEMATGIASKIESSNATASSAGQLKTMRLAQSCNAEYSNYFGATSAAQVSLVLAAFNATLTRCNGVYEKDLAIHLNLIANTSSVIYYNASTDPYTSMGSWNSQLQSTLTSVIGEANYDIGHMFGASGGGGNAGCIGCVCTNGSKGSGITSPADAIPEGDNFDIDYVVHEVGHQMGANHTFSHSLEGSGVNKEVGSGITIMGYAGITSQDVAPHSIDIFHQASIAQIQNNMAGKSCPVTTSIAATNATPVVGAVSNYTIPISTPFALTGSATDANAGDVLTYCWEQNNNATTSGSNSIASPTKATGPNWLSFSPTTSPVRYCPKLSTILAGLNVTPVISGGDAGTNIEALSSVARTLNFRLTVRDNSPYSSTAPVKVGQTAFTDMVVTVTNTSGPFVVTSPNIALSWPGNSSQAITWNIAGTTLAPVSCTSVKISLSTDGGQTFPTVLIASTPNDGTETLVIPNTATTTARIKVEAIGNIFFDISNANFTITAGSSFTTIATSAINPLTYCAGTAVSVPFTTNGAANAGNVFTAQLSNAAGSFASPVSIGTLTSAAAGTIAATVPAGTAAGSGYRIRVASSNPVVTGSDNGSNIMVNVSPAAPVISAGGATTFCQGGSVLLSGNSTGGVWSVGGGTTSTLTATITGDYFTTTTTGCGSVQSNHISVSVTPNITPSVTINANPAGAICAGTSVIFTATPSNGGTPPAYNWKVNGVSVSGGSQVGMSAITLSNLSNGNVVVCDMTANANAGSCVSPQTVSSNAITMVVNAAPVATATAVGATTFCQGGSVVINANTGAGLTYQWRSGTSNIGGATSSSYTASASGNYNVIVTSSGGCKDTSSSVAVTVSPLPTPSVISAGGPTTFCQGGSVLLSGNSTGGVWSVGGGTTATLTATTTGDYFTTTTNGCGSAQSNHISITATPSVPVSVSISANPGNTVCSGTSITFTATPTNGGAGPSYAWKVNNIDQVASGNTFAISSPVNGTTIQCVLTSNVGSCASNNPATSNTITLTVNPLPTVSFSGLATSYPGNAASAVLTGTPAGGTFSGPGMSGNTFTPATAGVGGPYSITYTYTNANGCTNSNTQQTTVTGSCTVPAQPGAITTVGGTAKVCPGDVKTYTIVAVSGATSYTWTAPPGGVVTGGQGTTSATVTYNAGFTVGDSLRVTANNTCGSSKARALKINRNAAASTPGAITGDVYGVCNLSAKPYSVTSVAGVTYAWSWSVADATIASGQGTNAITANFLSAFVTGKLSVTATNACGTSSARSLTVYARPAVPTPITGATAVCSGQSGVPYSISPVANASSYIWYGPSGSHISDGITTSASSNLTTTATNVTVNFGSTAGQVRVKGVNTCAAGGVGSLTVAFTCKENDLQTTGLIAENNGNIYPNPTNGDFRMHIGNIQKAVTVKIEIRNQFGQVVYQSNTTTGNGMVDLKLGGKLADGIYMVSYMVNGEKVVKKLMISK